MTDRPQFSYAVAEEVSKRLDVFFKDLPAENVQSALEELIDDYCHATFGLSVIDALRDVKMPSGGQSQVIQTLASGRAVLISSYGFNVKSQCECKCGRAFMVLDEMNHKDFKKQHDHE